MSATCNAPTNFGFFGQPRQKNRKVYRLRLCTQENALRKTNRRSLSHTSPIFYDQTSGKMCRPVCCLLYALCGVIYTAAGSVQLVAGVFFLFSLPVFKVGSNIWTGACDVFIGVGTFMLCCFGDLSRRRTLGILYLALLALIINVINLVLLELGEWYFFMTEEVKDIIKRKNLHDLIFYAHISTSVTTAIVIIVAFLDSIFTFCSLQFLKTAIHGLQSTNETVSDIEYIIPRNKSRSASSNKTHSVNQYTQSWVYDSETGVCSVNDSPYAKPIPSAPQPIEPPHYSSAPVVQVQVDPVTERGGDGDRQINHMKSFSRTPSPAEASQSSSSSSIPPIYECLERLTQPTVYRSRLSTYKHLKDAVVPPNVRSRVQSGDKEHYASLMVELENSFTHKKEQKTTLYAVLPSSASKSSTGQSGSLWDESLPESSDSRQRSSDAEFSKELEAALKLIQDLESPNTIDTLSESCKLENTESNLSKRRKSEDEKNDSDSTKTLSGSSSLEAHGKNHRTLPVESQSTSGYNSPSLDRSSRLTPTAGFSSSDLTVSQENGLSCVIRHMGDTAVISLFSPTKQPHPYSSADKISDVVSGERNYLNNLDKNEYDKRTKSLIELKMKAFDGDEKFGKGKIRKWRHLLERKRRPSLLPEVESAIIKSESLAFLSKSELKDRLNQTKSIHRQIEAKVHRQRSLRKAESFGSVEDIIDRNGVLKFF